MKNIDKKFNKIYRGNTGNIEIEKPNAIISSIDFCTDNVCGMYTTELSQMFNAILCLKNNKK